MESVSSRRYSRRYTGSITSSFDFSSSTSSIAHTVRKYSSPSLTGSLLRNYACPKALTSPISPLTPSFATLGRRKDDLPSDSGYWSSSSTPKSQTRASSETPTGIGSAPKEDISSVMGRYLPGGYVREAASKPCRAGSLSNLSSSLMSSLTSLSSGSANFMTSSVLEKRASRKRRELLASTRASSVERCEVEESVLARRRSSVERADLSDGRIVSVFSRSQSASRSGSVGRTTPDLESNVKGTYKESGFFESSSWATFDSGASFLDKKRIHNEDDPSGLLKIQEGLARVTEALNRHQGKENGTLLSKKSTASKPTNHSIEPQQNGNSSRIKPALFSSEKPSYQLRSTYGDTCRSSRYYSNKQYPNNNKQRRPTQSTDRMDDITASLLLFKTSEGSISGRRPWRRGRVVSSYAAISTSDQRAPSSAQLQSPFVAEARLAQRRAARAEARELRLRELEKQQQQNPETNDDASDMSDGGSGGRSSSSRITASSTANNGHHHPAGTVPPPPPLPHYTRHSSEESNPDDPAASKDIRELEEKFRGAMISNAQLDNEKSQLTYQVELLKDIRSDMTEQLTQLKKEHKKKCSEHEQLRKVYAKLQEESRRVRRVLEQRDELIQEYGLVVVGGSTEDEEEEDDDEEDLAGRQETEEGLVLPRPVPMKRVLLSQEAAEILEKGAAKGSLEWRLRRVVEHKHELEDELRRVNLELEEQVNNQRQNNCLDSNIQKEANKTVNEYKFKVQRAEAEVSSLQANVNRLEVLVTRYKAQVEELEKSEEELKLEKRKLQRELRDAQGRLEELETTNSHLLRRFEKLKNARSNLLKDLSQDPV